MTKGTTYLDLGMILTEDDHWAIIRNDYIRAADRLLIVCKECEYFYTSIRHSSFCHAKLKKPNEKILSLYNLYKHLDKI